MESGITIELEQSFASVVRYIQNKADNNAALYFDDLPEAFAVPSLFSGSENRYQKGNVQHIPYDIVS